LDADVPSNRYLFGYTRGAVQAQNEVGFQPLPAFPNLRRSYESSELFPLFKNRVLDKNRRGFSEYLESLGLSSSDPIEILAVTGGERQTDSFEVFPKIEVGPSRAFVCRFFVHGMRYMPESSQERARGLAPGVPLSVSIQLNNPKTRLAIQLATQDNYLIGFTPHYLVDDLLKAISEWPAVNATVLRVNQDDVPANRRVLVQFEGKLPAGVEPMSSDAFQLLSSSAH
jgi:hypothetical protein